jgi:hypothetical protein
MLRRLPFSCSPDRWDSSGDGCPGFFQGILVWELLSLFLAMTSNEGCFGFALTQAEEGQNEHDHHN